MDVEKVAGMLAKAQKRPDNRIMLRLQLVIISSRPWPVKEGEKPMFTYKAITADSTGSFEFNSSRVLPVKPLIEAAKAPVEMILNFSGFRAFEQQR